MHQQLVALPPGHASVYSATFANGSPYIFHPQPLHSRLHTLGLAQFLETAISWPLCIRFDRDVDAYCTDCMSNTMSVNKLSH